MVTRGDLSHDQKILLDAWVSYWDFQNKKMEDTRKREEQAKIDKEIKEQMEFQM